MRYMDSSLSRRVLTAPVQVQACGLCKRFPLWRLDEYANESADFYPVPGNAQVMARSGSTQSVSQATRANLRIQ